MLSQVPVALPFWQNLQDGKNEADAATANANRAEKMILEADDEVGGCVSVRAAEGFKPWRCHHATRQKEARVMGEMARRMSAAEQVTRVPSEITRQIIMCFHLIL